MLAIRMQRTGRRGRAMFRVIVQDSRRTPTSGKVVAQLGSYDPHAKTTSLDKDKAAFYLSHGAQPSDRVARLLKSEGVKLPDWVEVSANKERTVRNADKRRSTRPEAPAEEAPAAETETETTETPETEAPEAAEAKEETTETTEAPEAEKTVAEAEEPAAEAADEPAEESVEEPAEKPAESTEEPAEEPAESAEETPAESEPESKPEEDEKAA